MASTEPVPGYAGSVGPFPAEYGKPHVYARDIHSGAGNCVCGSDLGAAVHTEAAPGVPVPQLRRRATPRRDADAAFELAHREFGEALANYQAAYEMWKEAHRL